MYEEFDSATEENLTLISIVSSSYCSISSEHPNISFNFYINRSSIAGMYFKIFAFYHIESDETLTIAGLIIILENQFLLIEL